jgi:hypothetical protein
MSARRKPAIRAIEVEDEPIAPVAVAAASVAGSGADTPSRLLRSGSKPTPPATPSRKRSADADEVSEPKSVKSGKGKKTKASEEVVVPEIPRHFVIVSKGFDFNAVIPCFPVLTCYRESHRRQSICFSPTSCFRFVGFLLFAPLASLISETGHAKYVVQAGQLLEIQRRAPNVGSWLVDDYVIEGAFRYRFRFWQFLLNSHRWIDHLCNAHRSSVRSLASVGFRPPKGWFSSHPPHHACSQIWLAAW